MLDIQPALTLCLPVSSTDLGKQFGPRSGSKLFDILMFLRKKKSAGDKKIIKIPSMQLHKLRRGMGLESHQDNVLIL